MSRYYVVLYTKKAPNKKRKNKSFADGHLTVDGTCCRLYDEAGSIVTQDVVKSCHDLAAGAELHLEAWDIEIDDEVSEGEFRQRRQGLKHAAKEGLHAQDKADVLEQQKPAQQEDIKSPRELEGQAAYFAVVYSARAPGKKRPKRVFRDGVLRLRGSTLLLYDQEGKVVGKGACSGTGSLSEGAEMSVGHWDAELVEGLSEEVFRAGACFEKSSETLLLEKIRAPRGAGLHVRQEQANSSVGNTADATLSSACAAGSSATQQQKHTVKQQRLPLQSAQLTRPSGEGQGEGSALQQRDAVAQPCSAGVDVVASASDMQERRNGDVHDGKVFLDSVDCLDID